MTPKLNPESSNQDKKSFSCCLHCEKLLVQWQGPYEVAARRGAIYHNIHISGVGLKQYNVNLLKERKTRQEADKDPDNGLAGWEMSVDWEEEGRARTEELHRQNR